MLTDFYLNTFLYTQKFITEHNLDGPISDLVKLCVVSKKDKNRLRPSSFSHLDNRMKATHFVFKAFFTTIIVKGNVESHH